MVFFSNIFYNILLGKKKTIITSIVILNNILRSIGVKDNNNRNIVNIKNCILTAHIMA